MNRDSTESNLHDIPDSAIITWQKEIMNRDNAKAEIKRRWREIVPKMTSRAARNVNGEPSWVCPLCGHGTHGDGLTLNPKSADRNELKCFGCDFAGDIISLYMKTESKSYNDALSLLANELGLEIESGQREATLESVRTEKTAVQPVKQEEQPLPDFAGYYDRCRNMLRESEAAQDYLSRRGIAGDLIDRFCIGFDPVADPAEAGHPTPRIIIPVSRSFFIGRAIAADIPKQYAKMNPKGSPIDLFNLDALRGSEKAVFITEGIFDALSIETAGYPAISLNSVSNVEKLLEALRGSETAIKEKCFVLCLDGDEAGLKASAALRKGLTVIGANYIAGGAARCGCKDVNEALQHKKGLFLPALKELADRAEACTDDLLRFFLKIQTEAYKPIETGYKWFDDLIGGGFYNQTLSMFMAPPAAGKTALVHQIAEQLSKSREVLYINLEMSNEQMLARSVARKLARRGIKLSPTAILRGYNLDYVQLEAIRDVLTNDRDNIEYIGEKFGSSFEGIATALNKRAEASKRQGKPAPVVILDYLHLVGSKDRLDAQETIKRTVLELKKYAIDHNSIVIAISASNRASNKAGTIDMDSGRDSSGIEYTCDLLIGLELWSEGNEDKRDLMQENPRPMRLKVLKNRFGETGKTCRASFHTDSGTFEDSYEKPVTKKPPMRL